MEQHLIRQVEVSPKRMEQHLIRQTEASLEQMEAHPTRRAEASPEQMEQHPIRQTEASPRQQEQHLTRQPQRRPSLRQVPMSLERPAEPTASLTQPQTRPRALRNPQHPANPQQLPTQTVPRRSLQNARSTHMFTIPKRRNMSCTRHPNFLTRARN